MHYYSRTQILADPNLKPDIVFYRFFYTYDETSHSDPTDPNSKPNCVLQEQELLSGLLAATIHDFEVKNRNNRV